MILYPYPHEGGVSRLLRPPRGRRFGIGPITGLAHAHPSGGAPTAHRTRDATGPDAWAVLRPDTLIG
jgi:hypothetical protein